MASRWVCPSCGHHKYVRCDDYGVWSHLCLACGEHDYESPAIRPQQPLRQSALSTTICPHCGQAARPTVIPMAGTELPVDVYYCGHCKKALRAVPQQRPA